MRKGAANRELETGGSLDTDGQRNWASRFVAPEESEIKDSNVRTYERMI